MDTQFLELRLRTIIDIFQMSELIILNLIIRLKNQLLDISN